MSIARDCVRRFDQESAEKLEFCGRGNDGCSDASTAELDLVYSSSSSLSSSSIGRNSDASGRLSENEEDEVQSPSLCEEPLDKMESLEEALPLRRGISKFYNGKSKSFTTLAYASSTSSIKEIGKSENAYTRRRRNLLAFSHVWDKNRSRRRTSVGVSKRPIISSSSSRSTLAFAVAMSSCESISSQDSSSRSPPLRPPLYPLHRASGNYLASLVSPPWRSHSAADLQRCASAATLNTS